LLAKSEAAEANKRLSLLPRPISIFADPRPQTLDLNFNSMPDAGRALKILPAFCLHGDRLLLIGEWLIGLII